MLIDYIIVGFGVSGLALANALQSHNKDFMVYADQSQQATKVAGGLVNPVMLKTGKLVWNINEFLPYAKHFYNSLDSNYFADFPIHRIFNSIEEQNTHISIANSINEAYVTHQLVHPYEAIKAPFKMSNVKGGGVVQIQQVLQAEEEKLLTKNQFFRETFNYSEFQVFDEHVQYKNTKAKHIIFC